MTDLTGQTALVTGANGGIGLAIAEALHRRGAKVRVSGRRRDALEAVAKATNAEVHLADLAVRTDVDRLIRDNQDVDILVLNAALPASGPALDFTAEALDAAIDVNLRAPLQLARSIGAAMVARGRGEILPIASLNGKVSTGGTSAYSGTKFGMRGYFLSMRQDLHGTGVNVSIVSPGFIRDAGMFARAGVALPAVMGTRSPEDVARAVLRAIDTHPAELEVAALDQRFGALLAAIAPGVAGSIGRIFGADLTRRIAAGQRAHQAPRD